MWELGEHVGECEHVGEESALRNAPVRHETNEKCGGGGAATSLAGRLPLVEGIRGVLAHPKTFKTFERKTRENAKMAKNVKNESPPRAPETFNEWSSQK